MHGGGLYYDSMSFFLAPVRRTLLVLIVVIAGAAGIASWQMQSMPDVVALSPIVQRETLLTGISECLPHRETGGTITMECALGLLADDGLHYALDLRELQSDLLFDFPTGQVFSLAGILVPIAQISNDTWRKYDIAGILRVTSAQHVQ